MMRQEKDKQLCLTADELLASDVVDCISSMMRSATKPQVREALQGVEHEKNGTALHLVVCEYTPTQNLNNEEAATTTCVVAAEDLTTVFFRLMATVSRGVTSPKYMGTGPMTEGSKNVDGGSSMETEGAAALPRVTRCVFITSASGGNSAEDIRNAPSSPRPAPLTLSQLNVHAMEMDQPLGDLQSLLQRVYEPVLRQRREDALRYNLQEFVNSMRCRYHFLTRVNLMQFVHPKLLTVCSDNPTADLHELVGLLHEEGDDVDLDDVFAIWSPCRNLLNVAFEADTADDGNAARPQVINLSEVVGGAPHHGSCIGDNTSRNHGNNNNGGVLEEVSYWQEVRQWINHIRRQLRSREWRLAHYLLRHRVPTSYEREYELHSKLAHSYEQHAKGVLQLLPHINDVNDITTFLVNALRIIEAAARPGAYPRKRCTHFVNCVVHNIMEQFVALADGLDVLHIQPAEKQLQKIGEMMKAIVELQRCLVDGVLSARIDQRDVEGTTVTETRNSSVAGQWCTEVKNLSGFGRCSLLLERMKQLKDFLNEHFHYYRTLAQTFAEGGGSGSTTTSFCRHLAEAYSRFTADVVERGCLWDVSPTGAGKYQRIRDSYSSRVSRIDDRLALHVGISLSNEQERDTYNVTTSTVKANTSTEAKTSDPRRPARGRVDAPTAGGSPLYRAYSCFCVFRREKVLAVLASFRAALREQIDREINDICEEYFGKESCPHIVRATVARLGVTEDVGRMLWERSLQRQLETHMERREEISEHGWRQLLLLRTLEHRWCLNESLARFFGARLQDLVVEGFAAGSEVHGTAYALAFLSLVHSKNELRWSRDPHIQSARQYLDENSPQSLEKARLRLVLLRKGSSWGSKQSEPWDVLNFRDSIAQKLNEHVERWCNIVQSKFLHVDMVEETMAMKGPFLRLSYVERGVGTAGGNSDKNNNFHRNNEGNIDGVSRGEQVLVPNIPQEMYAFLRDFYTLESVQLQEKHKQLFGNIRCFFLKNEARFRIANSFRDLTRVFEEAVGDEEELMAHLITDEYAQVYGCLVDGAKLTWLEEDKLLEFTQRLSCRVYNFCSAASSVRTAVDDVERILQQLHSQTFAAQSIVEKVEKLCGIVKQLGSEGSSREWYVQRIQPRLDAALLLQLQAHLHRWTVEFLSMGRDPRFLDPASCTEEYKLRPLRIRMRVLFKGITLATPEAACRYHWLNILNNSFAWLHAIPALHSSFRRSNHQHPTTTPLFGGGSVVEVTAETVYGRLVDCLSSEVLAEPMTAIDKSIQEAFDVEKQWRRGQQLLNLEVGVLQQKLGDDLVKWEEALHHIREFADTLMNHTQPSTLLGGILIVASDAQKELGRKLDNMTQYINSRYREVVSKHLELCHRRITEERTDVEKCDVINSIDDACMFICELPTIYTKLEETGRRIAPLVAAEEYLKNQGLSLPDSGVCVKKVKEEHQAYKDLIARKVKAVELRRPFLRENAKQKGKGLQDDVAELEKSLAELDKQIQLRERQDKQHLEELADSMQERFYDIQKQILVLEKQHDRLTLLCKVLGIQPVDEVRLQSVASRTENLRWVFGHLLEVCRKLNRLSQTPFSEVDPQRLHEDIISLQAEVQEFPPGVRGHPAHNELVQLIEERLAARWIIHELSSRAMMPVVRAERHWSLLRSKLGTQWKLEELTVGDIWRSDPMTRAKIYYEVLDVARGEHRLETKLEQITAFWNNFEFNTTIYKKKHVLIRGWDAVFAQLSDDIDTLQGFHLSPFYSASHIAASVTEWESRLNLLLKVLEVLMGVQRRWVHLDGLFSSNEDIYQQLSSEGMQFDRVTWELWNLMPYRSSPFGSAETAADLENVVVRTQDFLEEKRLLSSLERVDGQLTRVQRALNRYLDRQRRLFPRFFYVGDDDLLETLGNSNNPTLIAKHLPKMFTALARLIVKDMGASGQGSAGSAAADLHIVGFACEEGEEVATNRSIRLEGRALHLTLNEVEIVMTQTLRQLTVSAAASLADAGCVTTEWIEAFPLQVVCLAFQVWWAQLQEQALATWKAQQKREPSLAVSRMVSLLDQLALEVTAVGVTPSVRRASEELITLAVYQRDVSRLIELKNVTAAEDFEWMRILRLYVVAPDTYSKKGDAATDVGRPSKSGVALANEVDYPEVHCRMADASLIHGFEYIGWYRRLVQTPLTDRCYLAMTQALHTRLGGSPVGPAGTGKTETVKSLGAQLGRHVVVFNCTDTFDFSAIGRILMGLCQVGAWGCFDEFNRLEECVLSAVAQQIRSIQEALRGDLHSVNLSRQQVPLKTNVALFITMNPDFADRSQLPGNLKQLFRTVTMVAPDREAIAEVMLFAQGFRTAESLSRKVVPLFDLCREQLSRQSHYDFGLRALKSVLVIAGEAKHADCKRNAVHVPETASSATAVEDDSNVNSRECELMLGSLINNIVPRLISEDVILFYPLLRDFFPGRPVPDVFESLLRSTIEEVCQDTHYTPTPAWVEKIYQLYRTRKTRHGLMLVGPSGTGKTSCWKTLLRVMARLSTQEGHNDFDEGDLASPSRRSRGRPLEAHAYVIDPKAMTKAELFGVFEATTREWKDGIFTDILRRIVNNSLDTNSTQQQHWIIFDGDVDPLWVENLNSLLDDSKIYTLPNGERLSLPPSVRIVFEVQDLRYATPATVSRCGMVWFSHGTVPVSCLLNRHLTTFLRAPMIDKRGGKRIVEVCDDHEEMQSRLCGGHFTLYRAAASSGTTTLASTQRELTTSDGDVRTSRENNKAHDSLTEDALNRSARNSENVPESPPPRTPHSFVSAERDILELQVFMVGVWTTAFAKGGLLERAFEIIHTERYRGQGIMEHNDLQILRSIQSLLLDGIWSMWQVREKWGALPTERVVRSYAEKLLNYAVFWGFGAALNNELRRQLLDDIGFQLLGQPRDLTLMDVEPDPVHGTWRTTRERVQPVDVDPEDVGFSDVIIPTVDACRNRTLLEAWITGGDAVILCGPPGSGKTILVTSLLRDSFTHESVFLNFSSGTRPENIIRALEQYCSVHNHAVHGPIMTPTSGKRLLLFCDEVNLPALDQYGTQPVVQFLRQLVERKGYYRSRDNVWVTVEGVQVIGACNPPTDKGRVSLSHRFLRWAPVLFVDFPTEESLHVIYSSYCRAMLSFSSRLQRYHPKCLAAAMVDVYTASQSRFNTWQQPHYVYSPRELTRWIRALRGAILSWSDQQRCELTVEELVQLAIHEGLRIFQDRLVQNEEREWAHRKVVECFARHFTDVTSSPAQPPLLFSSIVNGVYMKQTKSELVQYVEEKVRTFCEGEGDTELVVLDTMVDHVVRIDRVLRQPSGHMVLVGASGVGKTIITRLVAWMNGMSVFRIDVNRGYQLADYERDLREVLRRAGCGLERICFIFDDSNAMETGFLEYINALLPSGEIPGLFDGDKWAKLMDDIRASVEEQQSLKATSGTTQHLPRVLQHHQHEREGNELHNSARTSLFDRSSTMNRRDFGAPMTGGGYDFDRHPLLLNETAGPMLTSDYIDITSEQVLYRWFVNNVRRNLHVVFVTDPSTKEFADRVVTSPALFNRCTINWLGEWDRTTRAQLAQKLTQNMDVMFSCRESFSGSEDTSRKALTEALSAIHEATEEVNSTARQRNANSGTFITPRHFSDLLQQLKLLYEEKKGRSMEQLTHLRSGLAKLATTSEEVGQQQTQLREHEVLLDERSAKAQAMLERIVSETERTKQEKQEAEQLRQQLKEEEDLILADRARVEQQLSEAAPALREAEEGLNSIKQEYLREMRAYTTPPTMVKRVLETVLVVMGERRAGEWDVIKHYVRRDDFIASVKAFQARDVTEEAVQTVRGMLQEDGFTYEAAMRASKAAGPLLQWVTAQINYAIVYAAVQPLRSRIDQITITQGAKQAQLERTETEISTLEKSLQQLKEDYQSMAEEIATCKSTMGVIASRCDRATKLLQQLLEERDRWGAESLGFDSEVSVLLGNCILAAASLTYFGYFDEYTRQSLLLPVWVQQLKNFKIRCTEEHSSGFVDYLVTPSQRLEWEQQGLPKDNLCAENAMILHRSRRYPLLIDPSGVATAFLQKKHKDGTMRTTSFTKSDYLKQLDMAIRFGYALIIEDAEFMDPIIGPLLKNEMRRVGGRTMTRLGGREVETTSSFSLILITRDSHYQPPPGIAGRVCLVNFAVTLSSLESQCRHRLLLHERADVDEQRARVLKVREEYSVRVRVLEQELLKLIAGSEGSILENNTLTVALERLKGETKALKEGIVESDELMRSITAVEEHYKPLATAVSKVYFVLRCFSQLHGLYQYSVKFIFRVLNDALDQLPPPNNSNGAQQEEAPAEKKEEDAARLQVLTRHVFYLLYHRARRGMFAQDHLVLATALGKARSGIADPIGQQLTIEEWNLFESALGGPVASAGVSIPAESIKGADRLDQLPKILSGCRVCSPSSAAVLAELLKLPLFEQVRVSLNNPEHGEAWRAYFAAVEPYAETIPPFSRKVKNFSADDANCSSVGGSHAVGPTRRAFITALLLLHTRRDAFVPAASEFLRLFFDGADVAVGDGRGNCGESGYRAIAGHDGAKGGMGDFDSFFSAEVLDLVAIQKELTNTTPLILVANAGSDPTVSLEAVASAMNVQLHIAVMGSADSTEAAERFLTTATVDGAWVLLKNIHIDRAFADVVVRHLHRVFAGDQVHEGFRLILSMEAKAQHVVGNLGERGCGGDVINARSPLDLPVSLVESSIVVVYEPPPGMKASLLQTLGSLRAPTQQAPYSADMVRIYLTAAWFHAVVMERLLYVPLGWSTRYEINDTEFWHTLQAVNRWVMTTESTSGGNTVGDIEGNQVCSANREHFPWLALQTIIGTALYGGKLSNDFDQFLLNSFCTQLFSPIIFEDDKFFALLEGLCVNQKLRLPSMDTLNDVLAWVKSLPDPQPLRWARLPASASRLMLEKQAVAMLERLAILRFVGEKEHSGRSIVDGCAAYSEESTIPRCLTEMQWAQKVRLFCSSWRSSLERLVPAGQVVSAQSAETPSGGRSSGAERCKEEPVSVMVDREYAFAMERLHEVLDDLQVVENICCGTGKPTADQRALIDWLLKDQIPPMWARSYSSHTAVAEQWMIDFARRVSHALYLRGAIQRESGGAVCLNLGLLFWPEAFVTTTKQQTARRQSQPLEQLQIQLDLMPEEDVRARAAKVVKEDDVWHIVGLTLFSASLKKRDTASGGAGYTCVLLPDSSTAPSTPVGAVMRWRSVVLSRTATAPDAGCCMAPAAKSSVLTRLASRDKNSNCLIVPLYASDLRRALLQVVELRVDIKNTPMHAWYERGTCLVAWSMEAY
ncbi:dynein heavy chain, cytosolic, putative [Trypanosoma brucei gambiense DAL972]|uniref:Dynein heavy chain, cytosolic, putative n=1 Tax=Trypanosoma brucei gambiense (strain MHOM/CI/86/DAL972) TaxID=679716 RepID=C9ZSM2_TRYB9|nr:dynein heavy chain, cytosolic, putative [Trypanosoma brucei gambiense DAL972]CBH12406.1 dynein heavy chain, cytosolic, putative [Trypanosoma brucei gambiense DAL972]|eukprot:XP_011774687.1 dynein heavy chain, cytosolic, putative [Trypanosoma brucei gambiense DAL972]